MVNIVVVGSHITRHEDYALSQQENHVSRQIGQ
jgi:hypothetical protein